MTNANRIRVLSVDDHPVLREGVGTIINYQADMSLAGTASNGREGIEAFRALRPDITLMDLRLPDLSGLELMIAASSLAHAGLAGAGARPPPTRLAGMLRVPHTP